MKKTRQFVAQWKKRLLAVLGVGALLASVAVLSNQTFIRIAHGDANAGNYNYVLKPPADIGGDKNTARLYQIIQNPSKDAGTTAAYVPGQYFVVSDRPHLQFQMRGGRYKATDNGGDYYDSPEDQPWAVNIANNNGYDSPIYYEVYQIEAGSGGDGVGLRGNNFLPGKLLGIINPRDPNVFPGIDNNPDSDNCSGGPCWRTFDIDSQGQNGGNITINGGNQNGRAKDSFTDGKFSNVVESKKFLSGAYPNLNHKYVFLIKAVNFQDQKNGYVTGYGGLIGGANVNQGCVNDRDFDPGNNTINCPDKLLQEASNRNLTGTIVSNGYFLRVPKDGGASGHKELLASAPSNLAFGMQWGKPPDQFGLDWEKAEPGNFDNLQFSAGGSSCRNDFLSSPAAPTFQVVNADWDRNGLEEKPSNGGQDPNNPFTNYQIQIQRNGGSTKDVSDSSISNNWRSNLWSINLQKPGSDPAFDPAWWDAEDKTGTVIIKSWNGGNVLYQGAAPFTTGAWPTCAMAKTVTLHTPKDFDGSGSRYVYDGGGNLTTNTNYSVDQNHDLKFSFGYAMDGTSPMDQDINWSVQLYTGANTNPNNELGGKRVTGTDTSVSPGGSRDDIATIPVDGLDSSQPYTWRACVSATSQRDYPSDNDNKDQRLWKCKDQTFKVNHGPDPNENQIRTEPPTAGNGTVNYQGPRLVGRFLDQEDDKVRGRFMINWTDVNGHRNYVRSEKSNVIRGASGNADDFTSDDVKVNAWQRENNSGGIVDVSPIPNGTLTQFIQDQIPYDVPVNWFIQGHDVFGASDLDGGPDLRGYASSYDNRPNAPADNTGLPNQQPPRQDFAWGPKSNAQTFSKNTPPNLVDTNTTKQLYDTAGNLLPSTGVTDGQTVKVKLTVKNTGETPTQLYRIVDYLGAVRDWDKPTNVTVTYAGNPFNGAQAIITEVATDHNQDVHSLTALLDGDNAPVPANKDRDGSWKIDLGYGGSKVLTANSPYITGNHAGLPAIDLQQNQTVVITYLARANRNHTLTNPDATNGNYERCLQVGNGFPTSRCGTVDVGDAHTFLPYIEDYTTSTFADLVNHSKEFKLADILAPFIQTQRGDIHSNGPNGISGYDSGGDNATYIVTAAGNLSHFTGNTASINNYAAGSQANVGACVSGGANPNGLDWRMAMIKNVNTLKATSIKPGAGWTSSASLGFSPAANLYESTGDITLTGGTISGVGTLLINGNLTINGNYSYADANASAGFIVLGNITINGAVTRGVGSYYAADWQPAAPLQANGCPNLAPINSKGVIDSGSSNAQLNVDGLFVGSAINFTRYFTNPSNPDTPTPAFNVYYDGRVVANPPPGFSNFRDSTAWYEVAP